MDQSTGFDAPKQYLSNLEDCINSAVDLPSSIKRYQDVLHYARSKVDFAIGHGLYMLPSNMKLQIGTITNYNNEILIAGDDQQLGKNERVNNKPVLIVAAPAPGTKTPTTFKQIKKVIPLAQGTESHTDEMTALSIFLVVGDLFIFTLESKTPTTNIAKAHKCFAMYPTTLLAVDNSQLTTEPIIPGSASVTLRASYFK